MTFPELAKYVTCYLNWDNTGTSHAVRVVYLTYIPQSLRVIQSHVPCNNTTPVMTHHSNLCKALHLRTEMAFKPH